MSLPALSPTMEMGTLVKWEKQVSHIIPLPFDARFSFRAELQDTMPRNTDHIIGGINFFIGEYFKFSPHPVVL